MKYSLTRGGAPIRKTSKFETAYHALEQIAAGSVTDETVSELKRVLGVSNSLLVGKAADVAARMGVRELIPDLVSAFERFMAAEPKDDKQCTAKISIARALNELEHVGDSVFMAGAYYVQKEPGYGEPTDSAVELRCACAYGLARIGHPDAYYVLADLLVDPETAVRVASAKALGYLGSPESELLLRLKVLTGDTELDVISQCFAGLMTMAPDRSLDFVARFLGHSGPVMECAALAIGESHAPGALTMLRKCWYDHPSPMVRRALLLPVSLLRTEEEFDFLLGVLRSVDTRMASEALNALSLYADETSMSKIREVVETRDDAEALGRFLGG